MMSIKVNGGKILPSICNISPPKRSLARACLEGVKVRNSFVSSISSRGTETAIFAPFISFLGNQMSEENGSSCEAPKDEDEWSSWKEKKEKTMNSFLSIYSFKKDGGNGGGGGSKWEWKSWKKDYLWLHISWGFGSKGFIWKEMQLTSYKWRSEWRKEARILWSNLGYL